MSGSSHTTYRNSQAVAKRYRAVSRSSQATNISAVVLEPVVRSSRAVSSTFRETNRNTSVHKPTIRLKFSGRVWKFSIHEQTWYIDVFKPMIRSSRAVSRSSRSGGCTCSPLSCSVRCKPPALMPSWVPDHSWTPRNVGPAHRDTQLAMELTTVS